MKQFYVNFKLLICQHVMYDVVTFFMCSLYQWLGPGLFPSFLCFLNVKMLTAESFPGALGEVTLLVPIYHLVILLVQGIKFVDFVNGNEERLCSGTHHI